MSGSKMTSTTIKEMRENRRAGKSKTDWSRVRASLRAGKEPEADDDSPDATEAMKAMVEKKQVGRPAGSGKKEQIAIRLDSEVIDAFRQEGPGWQTRINNALRDWLVEHSQKH